MNVGNLIIKLKQGESISVNGPASFTILETIIDGNMRKSLISVQATKDVKISKHPKLPLNQRATLSE